MNRAVMAGSCMKVAVTVRPLVNRRHRRENGGADDDLAKDRAWTSESVDVSSSCSPDILGAPAQPDLRLIVIPT